MYGDVSDIEGNNEEENINNGNVSNSKARKRKDYMLDDNYPTEAREKLAKRILLSLTKPSYGLGVRPKPLRVEHRIRLRYLLRRLVKQHDWSTASGVLSAYLKGTVNDRSPLRNRLKFSVLLELLKHVENHNINPTRIKNLYDIWSKKIGSMKSWPVESRYAVHLEFILFCLMNGNSEDAYQLAICLQQEKVDIDPVSKMIMGLTFYELWYSSIPKGFLWGDSDQFDLQENSYLERPSFSNEVGQSEWHNNINNNNNSVESYMAYSQNQCYSDASVMNDRHISRDVSCNVVVSMEVDVDHKREESHPNFQQEGFYLDSEEHEGVGDLTQDTLYAIGKLDLWLFPLRFRDGNSFEEFMYTHRNQPNDYYRNAIKYLQQALDSIPSASAALLPLVQLLLLGGHVKEALSRLEKECCNSASVLPIRIRAALLESFDLNNSQLLLKCFEDILKKDPTCCDSLAKLIKIYQNGDYSLESLLEMIALHLDATDADYSTWSVFASCFLKLSHHEEDCISSCYIRNEDELGQHSSYRKIPKIFTEGMSGKSWRLRCRWWLTRHFSKSKLESEIETGDLQLLTYKAACASYMYGEEFKYVATAYSYLEKENGKDLLLVLDGHRRNSFGFYQKIQKKATYVT